VVVLVGRANASIHVADRWLLAEPLAIAQGPAWRTTQESADLRLSFPGRTSALVRIVGEIKDRKSPLLDIVENKVFRGGTKEVGKLKVNRPTFMLAADLAGNGRAHLLVGTPDGVRLFADAADVTDLWGLNGAKGACAAVGDVNGDGKPDLVIGKTLWINQGGKFAAAVPLDLPDESGLLAIAIVGRGDIAALCKDGRLIVLGNSGSRKASARLWNDAADSPISACFGDFGDDGASHVMVLRTTGVTRYSLDPQSGPPADFQRLTGERMDLYRGSLPNGLKNACATSIDIDGNGRPDYLILAHGGGLLLVNRGYGAYRVVADISASLKLPFPPPITCWTAARQRADKFEDLLVLSPDGSLYTVENPPYAAGAE